MGADVRNRGRSAAGVAGHPMMTGVLMGVLLGICAALGVALYLNKAASPVVPRDKPSKSISDKLAERPQALPGKPLAGLPTTPSVASVPQTRGADATRFDFYKILPGTEEPVPEQELRNGAARPGAAKQLYYLQAGAFQKSADADNLKARLALAGLEAQVQTATLPDNAVWHRVRVGPFSNPGDVERVRNTLRENQIEPSVVKLVERNTVR